MINIGGIVAVVSFYLLIVLVGIWAAKKGKGAESEEEVMLAGRNIGLFVGIFTMTGKYSVCEWNFESVSYFSQRLEMYPIMLNFSFFSIIMLLWQISIWCMKSQKQFSTVWNGQPHDSTT